MDLDVTEKEKWNSLRSRLNNSYGYNKDWEEAIKLFNERINSKFFNPIRTILKTKLFEGEGFSTVTLQCAIIECFAAFRHGKIFKYDKKNGEPRYYYSKSKDLFIDFLLDEKVGIFKDNFYEIDSNGKKISNSPFNACDFYFDVRCGLMHEARTKKNWVIKAYPKKNGAEKEMIFLKTNNGKIIIYRTVLYYRLREYLKKYSKELKENTTEGERLRRLFARKLDHLLDYEVDLKNFDWWEDR